MVIALVKDPMSSLPNTAREILEMAIDQLDALTVRVASLDREIGRRAKDDQVARRLMTIAGIGAITVTTLAALVPPIETFRRRRDFAAWLGLTPLQHSTGGKGRLARTSRMGEWTLRRLLIIGPGAVASWTVRKGAPSGYSLDRMLRRKPPMLVKVALANKMARVAWALLSKGGIYRSPIITA